MHSDVKGSDTFSDIKKLFLIHFKFNRSVSNMIVGVQYAPLPIEHYAYATGELTLNCGDRPVRIFFFIPSDTLTLMPPNRKELEEKGFHPVTLMHAFAILNTDEGDALLRKSAGSFIPGSTAACKSNVPVMYFSLALWLNLAETDARAGFDVISKARYDELIANSQ